jgi:hypothetical protein
MATERFEITYAGIDVHNGAMDVYELAPALVAIGDLIRDTNRLFNGDRATIELRVDSDFKKSSFEIHLLLDQRMLESANETLEFLSTIDARGLIDLLFGAAGEHTDKIVEGVVLGLIALYKLLKGKKPKLEGIRIEDNHGTIIIDRREIKADAKSIHLYMNDPIRADLDRIVLPVAKDGFDVEGVEEWHSTRRDH